jgi:hypothetical protein
MSVTQGGLLLCADSEWCWSAVWEAVLLDSFRTVWQFPFEVDDVSASLKVQRLLWNPEDH